MDSETQTQDNFATIAQFDPLPSQDNPVWLILAAVLGGLVLTGLVLQGVHSPARSVRGGGPGAGRAFDLLVSRERGRGQTTRLPADEAQADAIADPETGTAGGLLG